MFLSMVFKCCVSVVQNPGIPHRELSANSLSFAMFLSWKKNQVNTYLFILFSRVASGYLSCFQPPLHTYMRTPPFFFCLSWEKPMNKNETLWCPGISHVESFVLSNLRLMWTEINGEGRKSVVPASVAFSPLFFHLQLSIEKTQRTTVPVPKWLLKWQHAETTEANACTSEGQFLKAQQKPCHLVSNGCSPFPIQLFTCSSSPQYLEASAVLQVGDLSQGFLNRKSIQPPGLVNCSKKTSKNKSVLSGDISFWQRSLHLCIKRCTGICELTCLITSIARCGWTRSFALKLGRDPRVNIIFLYYICDICNFWPSLRGHSCPEEFCLSAQSTLECQTCSCYWMHALNFHSNEFIAYDSRVEAKQACWLISAQEKAEFQECCLHKGLDSHLPTG